MAVDKRQTDIYSARRAVEITPGVAVIECTRKVYVGTTCNLQVRFVDDTLPTTLKNVQGGREYRFRVVQILAGTDIVALY